MKYSYRNDYDYAGKTKAAKVIDSLSRPIRVIIGGRDYDVKNKTVEKYDAPARISAFLFSAILFPIGIFSLIMFMLKPLTGDKKAASPLIAKINAVAEKNGIQKPSTTQQKKNQKNQTKVKKLKAKEAFDAIQKGKKNIVDTELKKYKRYDYGFFSNLLDILEKKETTEADAIKLAKEIYPAVVTKERKDRLKDFLNKVSMLNNSYSYHHNETRYKDILKALGPMVKTSHQQLLKEIVESYSSPLPYSALELMAESAKSANEDDAVKAIMGVIRGSKETNKRYYGDFFDSSKTLSSLTPKVDDIVALNTYVKELSAYTREYTKKDALLQGFRKLNDLPTATYKDLGKKLIENNETPVAEMVQSLDDGHCHAILDGMLEAKKDEAASLYIEPFVKQYAAKKNNKINAAAIEKVLSETSRKVLLTIQSGTTGEIARFMMTPAENQQKLIEEIHGAAKTLNAPKLVSGVTKYRVVGQKVRETYDKINDKARSFLVSLWPAKKTPSTPFGMFVKDVVASLSEAEKQDLLEKTMQFNFAESRKANAVFYAWGHLCPKEKLKEYFDQLSAPSQEYLFSSSFLTKRSAFTKDLISSSPFDEANFNKILALYNKGDASALQDSMLEYAKAVSCPEATAYIQHVTKEIVKQGDSSGILSVMSNINSETYSEKEIKETDTKAQLIYHLRENKKGEFLKVANKECIKSLMNLYQQDGCQLDMTPLIKWQQTDKSPILAKCMKALKAVWKDVLSGDGKGKENVLKQAKALSSEQIKTFFSSISKAKVRHALFSTFEGDQCRMAFNIWWSKERHTRGEAMMRGPAVFCKPILKLVGDKDSCPLDKLLLVVQEAQDVIDIVKRFVLQEQPKSQSDNSTPWKGVLGAFEKELWKLHVSLPYLPLDTARMEVKKGSFQGVQKVLDGYTEEKVKQIKSIKEIGIRLNKEATAFDELSEKIHNLEKRTGKNIKLASTRKEQQSKQEELNKIIAEAREIVAKFSKEDLASLVSSLTGPAFEDHVAYHGIGRGDKLDVSVLDSPYLWLTALLATDKEPFMCLIKAVRNCPRTMPFGDNKFFLLDKLDKFLKGCEQVNQNRVQTLQGEISKRRIIPQLMEFLVIKDPISLASAKGNLDFWSQAYQKEGADRKKNLESQLGEYQKTYDDVVTKMKSRFSQLIKEVKELASDNHTAALKQFLSPLMDWDEYNINRFGVPREVIALIVLDESKATEAAYQKLLALTKGSTIDHYHRGFSLHGKKNDRQFLCDVLNILTDEKFPNKNVPRTSRIKKLLDRVNKKLKAAK